MRNTQDAFALVQQLASLCATPGVSDVNISIANESINDLLNKIIKPEIDKFTAKAAGLIV